MRSKQRNTRNKTGMTWDKERGKKTDLSAQQLVNKWNSGVHREKGRKTAKDRKWNRKHDILGYKLKDKTGKAQITTTKRPQSNIKQQRCKILSCLPSGVFSLDAADGSLHWTIWEGAARKCLEKDRHFEKMPGRWLDEPLVYHRLSGGNFNRSGQQ